MHNKYQFEITFLTQLFWLKRAPLKGNSLYKIMGGRFFFKFLKRGRFWKWVWETLLYTYINLYLFATILFLTFLWFSKTDLLYVNSFCFVTFFFTIKTNTITYFCLKHNLSATSKKKNLVFPNIFFSLDFKFYTHCLFYNI